MRTKALVLALTVALATTAFVGCSSKPAATTPAATKPAATEPAKADATSGASIAQDEAAFEKKIAKDNSNYMVITTKDLTFTKDLTVESGVKKGTDGKADTVTRSLGLGTYTADKKVDKRFTINVPKLVVAGENVKIEYGTIKGDVYVTGKGFSIKDGKIDGNLYFATEELKSAFKLDETTKVTGKTEVKAYTK